MKILTITVIVILSTIWCTGCLNFKIEEITLSEQKAYYDRNLNSITLGEYAGDVELYFTNKDITYIYYYENEDYKYDISLNGQDLAIRGFKLPNFARVINRNPLRIHLSKYFSGQISVKTGSGDITLDSIQSFSKNETIKQLTLSTSSGDVSINNAVIIENIAIKTGSGDIDMETISAQSIKTKTGSGDIDMETISAQSIKTKTGSGDSSIENVTNNKQLNSQAGSGNIKLRNVSTDHLNLNTGSGDIVLDNVKSTTNSIHTSSGTVGYVIL